MIKKLHFNIFLALFFSLISSSLFASTPTDSSAHQILDLTQSPVGYFSLFIFFVAYLFVMTEEYTQLRKSKPVILAAGLIWGIIGWVYSSEGMSELSEQAIRHNFLEYTELMLLLLVAMTYVNSMQERRVFDALRAWLINKGFSFRQLFWMTGILAFFISPIADNLTTALLMCAVVMAVGRNNSQFISIACINIVVAANAGGAFSPFGDITTLMVWQKGMIDFWGFFVLFIPSVINFLVPAVIMNFAIADEHPSESKEVVRLKRGARRIVALFLLTIATAVCFHNFLGLPPVIGMLTGLGYLQLFGFFLKKTVHRCYFFKAKCELGKNEIGNIKAFDVFNPIAKAEWDTLLFFYGVVLCVGGLGFLGYLSLVSEIMYSQWGATTANIVVGLLSAIVDNIPVMFAVLTMQPDMSQGQWLLVTLTAGVGGSLLSIGSAAGVALMGQAKGDYTFFSHLKWAPVIALGYFASIGAHFLVNKSLF